MIDEKEVGFDISYEIEGESNSIMVTKNVEVEISADEIVLAVKRGEFDGELDYILETIQERLGDEE